MWLHDLKIGLGLWHGQYNGLERDWLRWYDKNGNWIPTQAEYEKQRASDAEMRAEKLAAKLKELGVSAADF